MNFIEFRKLKYHITLCIFSFVSVFHANTYGQDDREIKLSEFRPVSIYKVPATHIQKAKYPIIDFHSHDNASSAKGVDAWVNTMDKVGVQKSIVLSYTTGPAFDSVVAKYAGYKDRFEIWCGIDYTGCDKPDWSQRAVKELERCYQKGARGVGELGDKGLGEFYSQPASSCGFHIDDPRMQPIIKRCGELNMPISIHVAEDAWMYENPDEKNDGQSNAGTWHVDMTQPGILNHDQLVETLEHAVRDNPGTTFIACHLANTCSDLSMIARLFDLYPNLYADIAARYGELAPIPHYVHDFMEKYANRIVYGTDMGRDQSMYESTFRILESNDEHFYDHALFNYHWALYGLGLSAKTLKKLYNGNGVKILKAHN